MKGNPLRNNFVFYEIRRQQGLLGEGGLLKLRYLRYLLRYPSKTDLEQTPKVKYFSCK